jgi:hypothetical protein
MDTYYAKYRNLDVAKAIACQIAGSATVWPQISWLLNFNSVHNLYISFFLKISSLWFILFIDFFLWNFCSFGTYGSWMILVWKYDFSMYYLRAMFLYYWICWNLYAFLLLFLNLDLLSFLLHFHELTCPCFVVYLFRCLLKMSNVYGTVWIPSEFCMNPIWIVYGSFVN